MESNPWQRREFEERLRAAEEKIESFTRFPQGRKMRSFSRILDIFDFLLRGT